MRRPLLYNNLHIFFDYRQLHLLVKLWSYSRHMSAYNIFFRKSLKVRIHVTNHYVKPLALKRAGRSLQILMEDEDQPQKEPSYIKL